MDPNETLTTIRELLSAWDAANAEAENPPGPDEENDAYERRDACLEDLREPVAKLDEWLSGGGFLPDAWARHPEPFGHRREEP